MSKIRIFLLIVLIISVVSSIIGCDIEKDKPISATEEIGSPKETIEETATPKETKEPTVTPKEKVEETEAPQKTIEEIDPSKLNWENYLSEAKYNRNVLDIKTPSEYKIDIEFDPVQKKYVGKQWVKYVNNEDVSLSELYFHIYPNAFKEGSTTPYSSNSYIGGYNPGLINITKVMVKDKETTYSIHGDDSTLLKIPMESALDPEKTVEIYMEYEVILPNAVGLFGYGQNTFQIGNAYPIAAVYDHRGWNLDTYYPIGDPFYSDVSNYSVTIKAPKDFIIACSGKILSEKVVGDYKVWSIEANLMRDFAWAASEHFTIQEKVVDGVLVKNYLLPNNEKINAEAAELAYKSVEVYNKIFGKYPYEVLSVVTADATGMEYPGMVFVWKSITLGSKSLVSTITHEIAHQWWYGVVGNNQIEEPWLDESFAGYAEILYYDEVYGEAQGEQCYNKFVANYKKRIGNSKKELILTPTYGLKDNEYSGLLYKGVMFLREIEKDLGKDKFYSILNSYFEKYKYSIVTTKDFMDTLEELSGNDYDKVINKWFFNISDNK